MIVLGQGEFGGRQDGRWDLASGFGGHPSLAGFGQALLLFVVVEDNIHVLPRPGGARDVALPEDLQQFRIRNYRGIKIHLHRLGVIAEAAVRGMLLGAARVTHSGANDAFEDPEPGLYAPESPESEGKSFGPGGLCGVDGWKVLGEGRGDRLHGRLSFLGQRHLTAGLTGAGENSADK